MICWSRWRQMWPMSVGHMHFKYYPKSCSSKSQSLVLVKSNLTPISYLIRNCNVCPAPAASKRYLPHYLHWVVDNHMAECDSGHCQWWETELRQPEKVTCSSEFSTTKYLNNHWQSYFQSQMNFSKSLQESLIYFEIIHFFLDINVS